VEAEHLLDSEPRDHFGLEEHDPEVNPQKEVGPLGFESAESLLFHGQRISGSRRCVTIRPPAKKPMTAARDDSWRFESPEMAWPEVHPFA
jgi:hypothetical protein